MDHGLLPACLCHFSAETVMGLETAFAPACPVSGPVRQVPGTVPLGSLQGPSRGAAQPCRIQGLLCGFKWLCWGIWGAVPVPVAVGVFLAASPRVCRSTDFGVAVTVVSVLHLPPDEPTWASLCVLELCCDVGNPQMCLLHFGRLTGAPAISGVPFLSALTNPSLTPPEQP